MKFLKAFVIFFLIQCFCAIIAWIGGYDFDRRSPDVGFFTAMSLFIGAWLGAIPILYDK